MTEQSDSSRCYAVTVIYVANEDTFDDETGETETEAGTYALDMQLPIQPFVGLGLGLDPHGADPYAVTAVSVMRNGRVIIEIDSVAWPMRWPGWKKISDRARGLSEFY